MLLALSVPAGNERGPQYMEQVLDAVHRDRLSVSFEFGRHAHTVALYCRAPDHRRHALESQLRSAYPDLRLTRVPDDALDLPAGWPRRAAVIRLRSDIRSLRTWREFIDQEQRNLADPIAGLLATLAHHKLRTHIVLRVRPASLIRRAAFTARRLLRFRRSADDLKPPGKLFTVSLRLSVAAPRGQSHRAHRKLQEMIAAFGRFENQPAARFRRAFLPLRTFLLSTPELATLWHPVTETVRTDRLESSPFRLLEPPAVLPSKREEGTAVLGRVAYHGRREVFAIRPDDRRRHLFTVGKTGMGKSTLLKHLAGSDIADGRGIALIDPHGDLATDVAAAVPARRTNDVVLFDAADRNHPVAFNPLSCRSAQQRPLVASGIVSAFKKLYGDSWGPRLEHILRNALLALTERNGTSLATLLQLLGDGFFRRQFVSGIRDPVVRSFWQHEFAGWKPHLQVEALAPVQNKVGQFMSNPILRAILGQAESRLDLRRVMDESRILIVNLSKGRIGEDASAMLGSLFITTLQIDAMSRADVPEEERTDFFAYVDEFQNFATESFATILSEARKYRLNLTLANQYLDQMDEQTLHAVFGNVGSMIAFQVGARDAEILAQQFGGTLTPADLMALPRFTAYVRLLIDGMPSRPFSAHTLPPSHRPDPRRLDIIRRTSRHRYAKPVSRVQRTAATA